MQSIIIIITKKMYQLHKSYRQEATETLLTSYLQRLSRMHMYINLTFIAQKGHECDGKVQIGLRMVTTAFCC